MESKQCLNVGIYEFAKIMTFSALSLHLKKSTDSTPLLSSIIAI